MSEQSADYVIAGGGLCGCVLASRLREAGVSVILIETGLEDSDNPAILGASDAFTLAHTNPHLLHQYTSVSQRYLNDRTVGLQGGNVLGGGSSVNYAAWTRGHRADYDDWARLVGDPRWSYNELLPYFKKSENYCDQTFPDQHGYDGPIKVCTGPRGYPLEKQAREALLSSGLEWNPDMNSGDSNGVAPLIESWHKGSRQFAAKMYDLSGVQVMPSCHVARVIIESGKARGVELVNGQKLFARKDVIVSCGAVRTPQLLMLSGLGPKTELEKHGISVIADLPIGENLHDHGVTFLNFKLKNPEKGYALGHPDFINSTYFEGAVLDFLASGSAPDEELRKAAQVDGVQLKPRARTDYELACMYAPGPPIPGVEPTPMDGSFASWSLGCMSTTSRGSVKLKDTNAVSHPIVDPAYFSTEHDRAVMRAGMKMALRMTESPAGKSFIVGEHPPDSSLPALTSSSTDAEFDVRLKAYSASFYHLAGTAAMGTVIDSRCRVKGIEALRVIDASILPLSIGGHLQAPLYGIAESAADMLIKEQ